MQKIGFFGGCFNPPTNIHINIANNLIKQGKLDKIVFVPVNDYYKKENLAEAKHRFNMLKLAVEKYNNLEASDIEIKENRKMFATDAFKLIYNNINADKENNADVFFIMGSDNFNKMNTWKEYESIKDKYKYIIVNRNIDDVNSTQVREMIKNKDTKVIKFLDKDVYNYIVKNNLYN